MNDDNEKLMNKSNSSLMVLIGSLGLGGTERHLTAILPALAKRGWKIQVLTFIKPGILAEVLMSQGISVETLVHAKTVERLQKWPRLIHRGALALLVILNLIKKYRQARIQETILHFFLPEAYILGMIASILGGFRGCTVMSRRSQNRYQKKYYGSVAYIERILHRRVTYLLGNSRDILNELEVEGAPAHKLGLIYNGVNLQDFPSNVELMRQREATRAHLGISPNDYVLIMVANLIPYKGHSDLLQALHYIQNELSKLESPWHLLCVGRDDGIGTSLKQLGIALGLNPHIHWLGSRRDIPGLLLASDLGLLCSHEEGFSNAILEGMAASLPMVVTNVGGNREAVLDGITGFVVPAQDKAKLGLALLNLMKNKAMGQTLGTRGRERIETHFSLEACVDAYDRIYQELLDKQRGILRSNIQYQQSNSLP